MKENLILNTHGERKVRNDYKFLSVNLEKNNQETVQLDAGRNMGVWILQYKGNNKCENIMYIVWR